MKIDLAYDITNPDTGNTILTRKLHGEITPPTIHILNNHDIQILLQNFGNHTNLILDGHTISSGRLNLKEGEEHIRNLAIDCQLALFNLRGKLLMFLMHDEPHHPETKKIHRLTKTGDLHTHLPGNFEGNHLSVKGEHSIYFHDFDKNPQNVSTAVIRV